MTANAPRIAPQAPVEPAAASSGTLATVSAAAARITAWVGSAALAGMGLTMTVVLPLGILH